MVGLNGSALSYEDDLKQTEFNGTQAPTDTEETPSRRARSTQAARGPKPLLPRSLKEALQLAELLSKSKLIPKGFETPETCLVGILYGMEVGLSPIAALQRMAVIDGRPTIWGDAALALVQASGLLQSIKEEVIEEPRVNAGSPLALGTATGSEVSNSTSTSGSSSTSAVQPSILTAICTVRREGRTEPVIGSFSIEDAKRAGLWQKPGPWTDYPNRMLTMRARAFALRDAFPDVLAGLYIREEFEGKERQAFMAERDRQSEAAAWNEAATNGTNRTILSHANPQSDNQDRVARNALERVQTITSLHGFTPEMHEVSDTRDCNQSPLARRRAPPPPPEGAGDPAPVQVSVDHVSLDPQRELERSSRGDDVILDREGKGEGGGTDYADRSRIDARDDYDKKSDDPSSDKTIDPDTLLDLLDSALCCALDLSTFHEIRDDFDERMYPISQDHRKQAQKIIDRHHKRVQDLDRSLQTLDDNQNADDKITSERPRRRKTAPSHLGIRPSQTRDRRLRRKKRSSHSHSSWNTRHRLVPFELRNRANFDEIDDRTLSDGWAGTDQ